MRLKAVIISLICLSCPCAICYGQLNFAGVNGENGYAALRGAYVWNLDNGFTLSPYIGYYRSSDEEEDEGGSSSRYGLNTDYELNDFWSVGARAFWQPKALGYQNVGYFLHTHIIPFYRWSVFKNPRMGVQVGQTRYSSYVDKASLPLQDTFRQVETSSTLDAQSEVGPFILKAQWHKVIKYKNNVPHDVTFGWADVPFMTAVVQGFIKEASALHISYPTTKITPYAALARYRYVELSEPAVAVSAGLHLMVGQTKLSGGVEIFEPRREANRKTYFSMSAEVKF